MEASEGKTVILDLNENGEFIDRDTGQPYPTADPPNRDDVMPQWLIDQHHQGNPPPDRMVLTPPPSDVEPTE